MKEAFKGKDVTTDCTFKGMQQFREGDKHIKIRLYLPNLNSMMNLPVAGLEAAK